MQLIRQTMFTTGEVDEQNWKRSDVEAYLTAAQSLKNCEVGTTGLVRKRSGSKVKLDATSYADRSSKMYEFIDKNGLYYLVIAVNEKFHIFRYPSPTTVVVTSRGGIVVTARGSSVIVHNTEFNFIQTITTPYRSTDLNVLDYTQDNDSLIFTHPDYEPRRLYISDYSTTPVIFSFETIDIYPYPAYDFNDINYNDFTVNLSVDLVTNILTFQFTGLPGDPGFNSDWIGGQIIGGGNSETDPVGYAIITNVVYAAGTTTFTATIQIPFKDPSSGIATKGNQYSVKKKAWSDTLGWPARVLYYQNRIWYANTKNLPTTIFGSRINAPINFDVGTGRDSDAIIYTLGQTNSGAINWLNAGKQLEIFTENNEYACPQDQNAGLTPSTFSIRQQTSYGSSALLKPVSYYNNSYFCAKTGKALIDYMFTGVGLAYASVNVSAASMHLVKNPINRALIRGNVSSQDNFIYFLNPDNTVTCFQFAQETKLAALTPFQYQENVNVIDIVTINNRLFILKYFTKTSKFTVEELASDTRLDSQRALSMAVNGLVTGLDDLNGYEVQVIYRGQDYGRYTVANGQITVNNLSGIADTVLVGLLYDVEIKPMYLFSGPAASPFMKKISRIYVDYYQSLNFYINGKLVKYQNFSYIRNGLALQPQTDTAIISPVSGWNRYGNMEEILSITQSSPFDLQITSIAYQIDSAVI